MSEADAKIKRGEDVAWQRWQMTALDQRRRKDGPKDQSPGAKPGSVAVARDRAGTGSGQKHGQESQQKAGKTPRQGQLSSESAARKGGAGQQASRSVPATGAATSAARAAGKAPGQRGLNAQSAKATDAESAALEAERKRARETARKEGHAEGLKAGHAEGYAKGLEEGRKAARKELEQEIAATLKPVQHLAVHFSEALALLNDEMAKDLVDLALATGRQLAGDALTASPEQVVDLVRGLLHSEPAMHGKPRLWLHPQDHDLIDEHLGKELKAAGWTLQPDDQVSRGGCRLTSATGELDATWESRWQAVRQQVRSRRSASEHAAAAQALLTEAETAEKTQTIQAPEAKPEAEPGK